MAVVGEKVFYREHALACPSFSECGGTNPLPQLLGMWDKGQLEWVGTLLLENQFIVVFYNYITYLHFPALLLLTEANILTYFTVRVAFRMLTYRYSWKKVNQITCREVIKLCVYSLSLCLLNQRVPVCAYYIGLSGDISYLVLLAYDNVYLC